MSSVSQVDPSHPDCGSLGNFIFLGAQLRQLDLAEAVVAALSTLMGIWTD